MKPKEIRQRVFDAAIETVSELGTLHDVINDMPSHTTRWLQLIRKFDPSLVSVPDQAIIKELGE
jgi:hypothetical protein